MKNKLKSFFAPIRNDFGYKVLALALAVIVWVLVVKFYNPESQFTIKNIPININYEGSVPDTMGLVLASEYNKTVDIKINARRDIYATLNQNDINAYVDLSAVNSSGNNIELPVVVELPNKNIVLVEQIVKTAVLSFEKNLSANVEIKVDIENADKIEKGYIYDGYDLTPNMLSIQGAKSYVERVAFAKVLVNIDNFKLTNEYNVDYILVDKDGKEVERTFITSDFETINVKIKIYKVKSIPVKLTVVNSSGGNDEQFTSIEYSPKTIKVAGSEETIDELNTLDLGTIDVSEQTSNFEKNIDVKLANGIKNVGEIKKVKVKVTFANTISKTITVKNFEVRNLEKGLKCNVNTNSIKIQFRGTETDIKKLTSDNVKIILDFNDKSIIKGKNRVTTFVSFPDGLKVGVVGKYYADVTIS